MSFQTPFLCRSDSCARFTRAKRSSESGDYQKSIKYSVISVFNTNICPWFQPQKTLVTILVCTPLWHFFSRRKKTKNLGSSSNVSRMTVRFRLRLAPWGYGARNMLDACKTNGRSKGTPKYPTRIGWLIRQWYANMCVVVRSSRWITVSC